MAALAYDVLVSGLAPLRVPALPGGEAAHWSPLSHTLIQGEKEAVLVDPPITAAQADALADWVAGHDRRLTAIYVTHAHGDHWLGTARLLRRFPEARAFATAGTRARIEAIAAAGISSPWTDLFGDELDPDAAAIQLETVPDGGLEVEGHTLLAIEAGHSDTDETSVLHVPDLGLVVAGDVVYNNVHQYLAESADGGIEAWHRGLDLVASLAPRHVVAGHKDARRPDSPDDIDATREYLDTVGALLDSRPSQAEFVAAVLERYPERVNPFTVWMTARRLLEERPGAASPARPAG